MLRVFWTANIPTAPRKTRKTMAWMMRMVFHLRRALSASPHQIGTVDRREHPAAGRPRPVEVL
jgi:hypothetical protein